MKTVLLWLLAAGLCASASRVYPEYKQCHKTWANDTMGTTPATICDKGALLSCAAMALAGTVGDYTPRTLNEWMKTHGGYISGNVFVWASMNSLTMVYQGTIPNYLIEKRISEGYVVICSVNNGTHWVLAHSHLGDKVRVNDPKFNKTTYLLTEIDDGKTAVFDVPPEIVPQPTSDLQSSTDVATEQIANQ